MDNIITNQKEIMDIEGEITYTPLKIKKTNYTELLKRNEEIRNKYNITCEEGELL